MKKLQLMAMVLLIGIVTVSCEKEEGPAGPSGPAGTNGTDGNANVTVYGYGQTVFNVDNGYAAVFQPSGITNGILDSSIVLMYYNDFLSDWNMANGMGPAGKYSTVQFTGYGTPPHINVYLMDCDGTAYSGADVTWDSVRIFVIPATIFKSKSASKVNLNDYQSVVSYYAVK